MNRRRRLIAFVFGPLVLVLLLGLARFASARPACVTQLPSAEAHPRETHDLASHRYGPRVAASSAMLSAFHHPAFLVDDVERPSQMLKWVSLPEDHAPWVELTWDGEHDVDEVRLVLAGSLEARALDMRDYTLSCIDGTGTPITVRGNVESEPIHPLRCMHSRGVRIEFVAGPPSNPDVTRVYEIDVIGR